VEGTMVEYFNLDVACLENKEVGIKEITKSGQPDKTLDSLSVDISKIIWLASLSPEKTGLTAFMDDNRKYEEIQILQIVLKRTENIEIVADFLMMSAKCPTILIFEYQGKYVVYVSKLYIDHSSKKYNEVKGLIHTSWLYTSNPSPYTQKVLSILNMKQYSAKTLYDIYNKLFDNLVPAQARTLIKVQVWEVLGFFNVNGNKARNDFIKDLDCKVSFSGGQPCKIQFDYEDLWQRFMEIIPDTIKRMGLKSMSQAIRYMCDCLQKTKYKYIYDENDPF
jgi:hypothetical protein